MRTIDPKLVAALANRYRLEREIGAGGMATVYLADDLKHGRKVAVKVLRPDLAAALGPERFLQEIRTTANLRHPNVLPLYDSGEEAGFLYYVMPYLEGESLRDRLGRDRQLPVTEALRIIDEVADALGYAHGRGVIHRDVKPENILFDRGHAVVADFGIAQAVAASGDEQMTKTQGVIGTPHYMSPEQARGEAVDSRSDVYALGCVLYEMLAGKPPFTGTSAMAVLARHLTEPIPSLRAACPAVEASLVDAVERALAKTAAERFDTMQEWRDALRSAVTGRTPRTNLHAPVVLKPPPTPATSLLGREGILDAALASLRSGTRVLTITGPGGTGKTRCAVEIFHRFHREYPEGAAFVSLAAVMAAEGVMPAIGAALDIAEAHGRSPLDAVATLFTDRRVVHPGDRHGHQGSAALREGRSFGRDVAR